MGIEKKLTEEDRARLETGSYSVGENEGEVVFDKLRAILYVRDLIKQNVVMLKTNEDPKTNVINSLMVIRKTNNDLIFATQNPLEISLIFKTEELTSEDIDGLLTKDL